MLPFDTLLSFFGAALLLSLAPGPDNLFVLAQSARYGVRAGVLITLGLCSGLVLHSAAVAAGVAALVVAEPLLFNAIKVFGAAYLLWLAWQAIRSRPVQTDSAQPLQPKQLLLRGVLMNLSNPKVLVFFLALLPQFADPQRGALWLQLLMLGGLFIAAALLVFNGIAVLAGRLAQPLQRSPHALLRLNRLSALLFIALALRLAWA